MKPLRPNYNSNTNTEKIEPLSDSFFWSTTPPAFLGKDSPFFEILSEGKQLHVHRAEAKSLSNDKLQLSNGNTISVDALVFATGWQRSPATNMFSLRDCIALGLPVPLSSQPANLATHWDRLDCESDKELEGLFPLISKPPQAQPPVADKTPYRLYRHILPPDLIADDDRTIAFLSIAGTAHTVPYAELSALWAVAWMERLYTPMIEESDRVTKKNKIENEVALVNSFLRHRYLSSAKRPPAFIAEAQTVFDTLMRDLGLRVDRRRETHGFWGSLREYLTPYECSDYSGVVEELLAKHKKVA